MAEDNDVFDELESRASRPGERGDYADWWEPEEGERLVGVVVEKHSAPQDWTEPGEVPDDIHTVLSVGRGDFDLGRAMTPKQHVQLKRGLEGADIDDLVMIKYEGLVKTDSGNAANSYEISVIAEGEWRDMDGADEIEGALDGYGGIRGDNTQDEPYSYVGGTSGGDDDSPDDDESGVAAAVEAAEEVVEGHQDGEMGYDLFVEFIEEVKGFDVDAGDVIAMAGYDVEHDDVDDEDKVVA